MKHVRNWKNLSIEVVTTHHFPVTMACCRGRFLKWRIEPTWEHVVAYFAAGCAIMGLILIVIEFLP